MQTLTIPDRQSTLALNTDTSVHVVGCGGIGSWVTLALVKAGVREVHVWDHDRIELSNLHRTPFKVHDVGRYKVDALADSLDNPPSLHPHKYEWYNPQLSPEWVISCLDSLEIRQDVFNWYQAKGNVRHIEAGAEGDFASINDMPAMVDESPVRRGYAVTPQWIGPNLFAALQAVSTILYKLPIKHSTYQKGIIK